MLQRRNGVSSPSLLFLKQSYFTCISWYFVRGGTHTHSLQGKFNIKYY